MPLPDTTIRSVQPGILLLLILAAILLAPRAAFAAEDKSDILQQKQELERIQRDVRTGQKRLDSLKAHEASVQKQISGVDEHISANQRVVKRLSSELAQLQSTIATTETELAASREVLDRTQRKYLGDIRQFYLSTREHSRALFESPNHELIQNRQITYLTSLADFEWERVQRASGKFGQTLKKMDELSGQHQKVTTKVHNTQSALDRHNTNKQRRQQELAELRRRTSEESDRILMLQQAAREMEQIIAQLEEAERRRDRPDGRESVFVTLQGYLPAPCLGKVTLTFGQHVDQVTRLKSFSPGITIAGEAGRVVAAVAAGSIAYVGTLRGYGKFIIINHDDHYYTTYAGLEDIRVTKGDYVFSGTALARAGADGLMKFELRRGREALDPLTWLRNDAF
jgi:septal ring factor EnvC (AmiA/AmiB activator)